MRIPRVRFTVRLIMVLVVVLAFPMWVIALVDQAREAARDSGCLGQLFQYGFVLQKYQEDHGHLPPAFVTGNSGIPIQTWRVFYLPLWSEHELNGLYDYSPCPWNHPKNAALLTYHLGTKVSH